MFPGGKAKPGDADAHATCKREVKEGRVLTLKSFDP
jgi:hypothetical protein